MMYDGNKYMLMCVMSCPFGNVTPTFEKTGASYTRVYRLFAEHFIDNLTDYCCLLSAVVYKQKCHFQK